jgi:predicted DNA-binding transcriptional regulator YafY
VRDLNPRPPPCQGDALPAELTDLIKTTYFIIAWIAKMSIIFLNKRIQEQTFEYTVTTLPERMVRMNKLLRRSLNEHFPIEIIYIAQHNQLTKRKIIVKRVNPDSIVAYCFLRQQLRTFRVEHILAAYPLLKRSKGLYGNSH